MGTIPRKSFPVLLPRKSPRVILLFPEDFQDSPATAPFRIRGSVSRSHPTLVLCFLSVLACNRGGTDAGSMVKDREAASETKARLVRVLPLEARPIEERLPCTGNVESLHEVSILARVSAQVLEVPVEEGAVVAKGQVLVRLDDREAALELEAARIDEKEAENAVAEAALGLADARRRLAQAKLDLDQAARDHERTAKGVEQELYGAKDLEAAKLAHDRARNDLELARAAEERARLGLEKAKTGLEAARIQRRLQERRLEDYTVRAPFAGILAALEVRGGEWTSPQAMLGTLVDHRDLIVRLVRPQRELSRLRVGQRVEFRLDARPEHPFFGDLDWISPIVDTQTGTFTVRARLEDPEGLLRPGLFARAWIVTGANRQALMIPKTAVLYEGELPFAFVARDGKALRLPIERGIETRDAIEARNVGGGLGIRNFRFGDLLVVEGQKDLEDGRPLRFTEDSKGGPRPAEAAARDGKPEEEKKGLPGKEASGVRIKGSGN